MIAAACLWLVLLGVVVYYVGNVNFGVVAVPALLIIAYYGRLSTALAIAVIAGITLPIIDRIVPPAIYLNVAWESVVLALTLVAVVIVTDLLRRRTQESTVLRERVDRAEAAALVDSLTGMPNRTYFIDRLKQELRAAGDRDAKLAVLFADLDGFKTINDTHGHAIGDKALALAARRLAHGLRFGDIIARIGGDEFGIIVREVHTRSEALRVAEAVESTFQAPFRIDDMKASILGVTVGTSLFPDDARDAETLLIQSDAAMYARKRAKRGSRLAERGIVEGGTTSET